jgi:hypothetical protein
MEKSVILCPVCRRILSVGATMPAVCIAAIPDELLRTIPKDEVEHHPLAHDGCIEVFVDVPDDLEGQALLDAVMAAHGDTFVALIAGDAPQGTPPTPPPP